MATKVEIAFGVIAVLFFVCAADAWLGVGAVDFLVDLCLSDPDAAPIDAAPMPMPAGGGHGTHASLFLAAGLTSLGLGLSWGEIYPLLNEREMARLEGRARRRLIAAIVYVARSSRSAMPRDVAEAFHAVTGEMLPSGEVAKAVNYMQSKRAAPMERILGKVADEDEKRRILAAACHVWFKHGSDCERTTRAMEHVAAAMGLEGNDINATLDTPWTVEATRVLKNVESLARRTVSHVTTEAQRITTRIRGIG